MHKNEGRKPHQCFHKSGGKQRGVSVSMCVCPECPHQYNENGLFLLLAHSRVIPTVQQQVL